MSAKKDFKNLIGFENAKNLNVVSNFSVKSIVFILRILIETKFTYISLELITFTILL